MSHLHPGTRVHAKGQPGSINYVRMAPPDYREPEVYSVFLDSQVLRPGYAGTVFLATEVLPVTADTALMDLAALADRRREGGQ